MTVATMVLCAPVSGCAHGHLWQARRAPYTVVAPAPAGDVQDYHGAEEATRQMGLPPLSAAALPEGWTELRIWVDLGLIQPRPFLRIIASPTDTTGEVVRWWTEHDRWRGYHRFEEYWSAAAWPYGCNGLGRGPRTCRLRPPHGTRWGDVMRTLDGLRVRSLFSTSRELAAQLLVLDGDGLLVEVREGSSYRRYQCWAPEQQPKNEGWIDARAAGRIFRFVMQLSRG